MKGMEQHGKPLMIKSRVNFILPVGCKKKKIPKSLNVILCESRDNRFVSHGHRRRTDDSKELLMAQMAC